MPVIAPISWDGATADWYTDNWDYPGGADNGPPPADGAKVEINSGQVSLAATDPAVDVGGFSIDGSASFTVSGATFENQGIGTIAGTTLTVEAGGEFLNDSDGVVTISDVTADGVTSYGSISEPGIGSGGSLVNDGTIVLEGEADGGTNTAPSIQVDQLDNSGTIEAQSGYVDINTTTAGSIDEDSTPGTFQIDAGATLELGGPIVDNTVVFNSGDAATLVVDDLANNSTGMQLQDFNAAISGFAPGDLIEISTLGMGEFNDITSATPGAFDAGSDTTTLALDDGMNPVAALTLVGNYSGDMFKVTQGSSEVGISEAPCYCPGTLILTQRGEVPVEDLKIGDRVVTMAGKCRPIKWIGRRSYKGRFLLGQKHLLPICIKAGALSEKVPRRGLWISPHHAMYLEDVLIEAKGLVNGVSIVQAESAESVEYFHVELNSHDVIIAEGAWSESYFDDDNRGMFHNAHECQAPHRFLEDEPDRYCAPRLDNGYQVEAARRTIGVRAGLCPSSDAQPLALRGYIDTISPDRVAGWAQNPAHPDAPVCLDIYAGQQLIGQVLANLYREDLARAGISRGSHAFEFRPPVGLAFAPGSIGVRRSLDGCALALSNEGRLALTQAAARAKASAARRSA